MSTDFHNFEGSVTINNKECTLDAEIWDWDTADRSDMRELLFVHITFPKGNEYHVCVERASCICDDYRGGWKGDVHHPCPCYVVKPINVVGAKKGRKSIEIDPELDETLRNVFRNVRDGNIKVKYLGAHNNGGGYCGPDGVWGCYDDDPGAG